MVTTNPGIDKVRFYILRAWTTVTRELLLREKLEMRGTIYGMLPYIYPSIGIPPYHNIFTSLRDGGQSKRSNNVQVVQNN